MRQRFKNEAIAGRRLRHPNIVPVYEYGEDDECSYIVMAFVEGRPLKEALDAGTRSSIAEALTVMEQLLDALQYAHRNNVVHRDIKPANLLIGEDGQLQIADFGIAKIDLATLTRTGVILGTPAYMSPEQCLGTPSDHRADIFSAGVILYELLTGEQPFRANAALAVMHQVLSVEPVSPSKLNLDVSAPLDAVVAKAMAKRREERFQSARDFAQALKEAAKPRPAPAEDMRSVPTITGSVFEARDRVPSRTRPRRKWLAMAAIPAVAAVGVIAFLMTVVRSPGTIFRDRLADGSEGPEMVVVPAGRFVMGSAELGKDAYDDEHPQHEVALPEPFAMGKYEVSFEEYDRFAKATGRLLPDDRGWGRGRQPAINVSFDDARAYAEWLSKETGQTYRLPSEAEWEYAARAGKVTAYWWGRDVGKNQANCKGCGSRWDNEQTAPVGSFAANPWGLYDTAGNVSEWVEDCYHSTYAGAPVDGRAWVDYKSCGLRVLRGGSWFYTPWGLRSATRAGYGLDFRNHGVGFRLARTL